MVPADTLFYEVDIGESPVLGQRDAPVTIVGFFDFQCQHGVADYKRISGLVRESRGICFVMKHYPLPQHRYASFAHAAAELAKMEKGDESFWEMTDIVFANNMRLQVSDLRQYAAKLGLNLQQFDDVMADQGKIDALLAADKAEGAKCKITCTPTVLINGLKLQDRSPEGYKKRIDEILSKLATAHPGGQASADNKAGPS